MTAGIIFIIFITLYTGFVVMQGRLASKAWMRNVDNNNQETIEEALNQAFESWRRPKKNDQIPYADWSSIETMEVKSVTREKCRVSMISGPDIRIVDTIRKQTGDAHSVARRSAIMLAERLFFDVPFLYFELLQIDVYELSNNDIKNKNCILSTQVTRDEANAADWDSYLNEKDTKIILSNWKTMQNKGSLTKINPDNDAILE